MAETSPWTEPATDTQLARLTRYLGMAIPADLQALYERTDGEEPCRGGYRRLSIDEVLKAPFGAYEAEDWVLFEERDVRIHPFWTNDNSDYIALHLDGPLAGRLCYVFHDEGGYHLAFRSIPSLLRSLTAAGSGTDSYTSEEDMVEDYYGVERNVPTAQDKASDAQARLALSAWLDDDELDDEESAFIHRLIGLLDT